MPTHKNDCDEPYYVNLLLNLINRQKKLINIWSELLLYHNNIIG